MKKRILYIAPHRPGRSPGQRFRLEQYIEELNNSGFEVTYSSVISAHDDKVFYQKGKYLQKSWIGIKAFFIRCYDLCRCHNYDLIIIYREAHFFGTPFFEKIFARCKTPVAFDFDDAIWLNDTSDGNSNLSWLKKPEKTGKIIALANLVMAGNTYLAEYARQFNRNVKVIPTTINTNYHKPRPTPPKSSICIGWTGSMTTIKHFERAIPVLKALKNKYGSAITFKVIADAPYQLPEIDLVSTPWSAHTEINELNEIDIGIMPLPNDKWSKGKCGFKGIQYMALEKPAVMSPVGVNTDIIDDGKNGFLADSIEEWIEKLSMLIEDKHLRERLGKAGRQTIENNYSVNSQKNTLIQLFNELTR